MTKINTYPNSICSKAFRQEAKYITTKLDKNVKFVLKNTGKEYHISKKLLDVFSNTTKYVTKLLDMLGDKV